MHLRALTRIALAPSLAVASSLLWPSAGFGQDARPPAASESAIRDEASFYEALRQLQSEAAGDKAKAVKRLKALAVAGDARSQRVLGVLYLNGLGVIQNEKQALGWFEQAAEGRYPIAMVSFAELLLQEEGEDQDYPRARAVLEELVSPAAQFSISPEEFGEFRQAKARGLYLLGMIYAHGWGIEADKARAIALLEQAARAGEREATMYLAIAYAKGEDVAKSVAKAKEYFELLDLQSSDAINREIESMFLGASDAMDAQNMKEVSEEAGAMVSESILALQTQFAQEVLAAEGEDFDAEMAASLLQMAADGGYAEAQLTLGVLRYRGLGGEQDYAAASELFRAAADQDWPLAQYNLAVMIDAGVAAADPRSSRGDLLRRAADNGLFAAQALLDGEEPSLGVLTSDEARDLCLRRAEAGDARALYSLARRKLMGWGVEQEANIESVAGLYTKSAQSGYARAQYELGFMRITGKGVPVDATSGFSWLRSAAFQEYPPALHFMGTCYAQGIGVEVDFAAAFRYFSKSAELGFNQAKNSLALFYLNGVVVPRDEWKASQLYLEAADKGDPQAAQNIGNCYLLGQGVRADMEAGLEWIATAAELGNLRAAHQLAQIYSEGLLVDQDPVEVSHWIERLAEMGEKEAMKETAFNYYYGRGKAKNRGKAFDWITAYLEHPAPAQIGSMYLEGEYEDLAALRRLAPDDYAALVLSADLMAEGGWSGSDPKAAAKILTDLASKGFNGARLRLAKLHIENAFPGANPRKGHDLLKALHDQRKSSQVSAERNYAAMAADLLSRCYGEGLGVKASPAKELSWLETASSLGYAPSQYKLGLRLVNGEGVGKDLARGADLLTQAAIGGDKNSRLHLARLNLATPLSTVSKDAIVDWLKELVDQGSGEARALLRRYGVKYKEPEYEERDVQPDEEPEYDPWAPVEAV